MRATRIKQLSEWIKNEKLDALFVDNPVDIFYLTGLNVSLGRVIVDAQKATLFVDGRYIAAASQQHACGVELSSKEALIEYLKEKKKVGIDSDFFSVDAFETLKKQIPHKQWVCVSRPLKKFRLIKDSSEIVALKKAAQLTQDGYREILRHLKEGVEEQQVALEFEIFCRKHGASCLSFPPIIAFGKNSAYPHHRAGKTRLEKNQIVLIDIGAVVDEYRGDMTRVLFFGEADPKLYEVFLAVKRAQKKAVEAIAPGVRFGQLDQIARGSLALDGMEQLFTHGLSHGIGLETHEYPALRIQGGDVDLVLEPGMVFTVEPGVYIPGLGGVRYEDTVRVTETGFENFYPDDL